MTDTPWISVVMCVFNDAEHIGAAIASILAQTFSDFELIVIDDGSQDETPRVISQFADRRIEVVRNETNLGLTKSLNLGLRQTRGRYIARHDADDISRAERFAFQVEYLDSHVNCAVVGSAYELIHDDASLNRIQSMPTEPDEIRDMLFYHHCLCHGATMMRRSALEQIGGYDEAYVLAQDRDLWLRLAESYDLGNLPIPLYQFRISPSSLSGTRRWLQRGYARRAVLHSIERRRLYPSPIALSRFFWQQALDELSQRNTTGAAEYLNEAVSTGQDLAKDQSWLAQAVVRSLFEACAEHEEWDCGEHMFCELLNIIPDSSSWLRQRHDWVLAEYHAGCAFESFRKGDYGAVRRHCLKAWLKGTHQWKNRGLASIFLRSMSFAAR